MQIGRIFERYCVSVSFILRFAKKLVTYAGLVNVSKTQNIYDFKEEYP